jgi:molybdenum cofactor synthesis domain-containing protein
MVRVYAKPRVAILPTGDEVREPGAKLEKGQIYDVNSYTLMSIVSMNGAVAAKFEPVPDTVEDLKEAIKRAQDYDIVVFSGGSSVGERDLLYRVAQDLGIVFFHWVQIKPGKPTLFAAVEGTPVFGMPGYPTSCLSNAYLLLAPALRKMARLPVRLERRIKVRLAQRIVSSSGRKQFLTVKLREGLAYPVFKESGDITSMAGADGYLMLPANLDVLEEGQEVEVILFD